MGILKSTMYKLTSFLFCLLVLWVGQSQAKPQLGALIDKVTGVFDDCDDVYKEKVEDKWQSDQCAIVFDEDDCSDDGLKISTGVTTFTRNPLKSGYSPKLAFWHEEIDSIIVRAGCTLTAYKDSDCEGEKQEYKGESSLTRRDKDKVYDDLDDFEDEIECIKCEC